MDDELFIRIKRRLKISWDDTEDGEELKEQIAGGKRYLSDIARGYEIDFAADIYAYELLYNYVRYCRSDCLELFQKNYRQELLKLQLTYRAKIEEEAEKNEAEITN